MAEPSYQVSRPSPSTARVVAWLSWTHFLNDGIANYLPGVIPFILSERHIPEALAGTLMTALGLGQGLQPVAGWIADRIGGRALVLGGVALSTVSAAVIGWTHPLWLLLCFLLFTGIGNTSFHPQALSLTRQQLKNKPGVGMAVFLVGGEIGRSLGPLAAGLVVHRWGLAWIWLLALPLIISYPWIVKWVPPQVRRTDAKSPLKLQRHLKAGLALLSYTFVRSGVIYEITTLTPLMWHQRGGGLVTGAALVTIFIGIGIVGNLMGGALDDRIGKSAVLYGASALAAISLVAFIFLQGFWEWPVLGIMGIALFGSATTTMLVGQDIFAENPALGSGIALGLANALGAVMAFPLTYIAARSGAATAVWILIALTIVTIPAIRWMPLKRRST